MALFDIDKDNADRGTPMPNTHDKLPPNTVMAKGTMSTNYSILPPNIKGANAQLGVLTLVQTGQVEVKDAIGDKEIVGVLAHGLGYAPIAFGAINNATVTGIATPVNIMMPTWLNFDATQPTIGFKVWISIMSDATNVYFYIINTTGSGVDIIATYYLYRQLAVQ